MEPKWLNCMQKQELETGWKQERRSICHSMNKSHFIMRIHSIKSKRERVLMGRKETEDWGQKASCKQSMRQVLLMPLLPTPSFGEMDCIVFISLIPCVSLIINFYFSVCDSFPISDVRILLIVPEREKNTNTNYSLRISSPSRVEHWQFIKWTRHSSLLPTEGHPDTSRGEMSVSSTLVAHSHLGI